MKLKVQAGYAACTLYCSFDTVCPLCQQAVPAHVQHDCRRPTPAPTLPTRTRKGRAPR